MAHVNWWLVGVAFVLGLLLTLALTIRRVKREVPVNSSVAAAAAAAPAKSPSEAETDTPYGTGSARARPDGGGPQGWLVKGNEDSMLYHTPDSPHYKQTIAEVWFKDAESAEEGGFTAWYRGRTET